MGFIKKLVGKFGDVIQVGRGHDDLRDAGIKGRAEVIGVEPTGRTIGTTDTGGYTQDADEIVRVRARVTLPDREPYEVDHETTQQPTPGGSVDCWVDPSNPNRVHYDEMGAMPGLTADQSAQIQAALDQANELMARYQQGMGTPPGPGAPTGG